MVWVGSLNSVEDEKMLIGNSGLGEVGRRTEMLMEHQCSR